MAKKTEPHIYHRRDFLTMAGTGVVAVAGIGLFPGRARAGHDPGHIRFAQAFKAKFGDTPMKSGRITMDLPQIAQNGNSVPMGFEVDSPMTTGDYVKAVHIFAEMITAARTRLTAIPTYSFIGA